MTPSWPHQLSGASCPPESNLGDTVPLFYPGTLIPQNLTDTVRIAKVSDLSNLPAPAAKMIFCSLEDLCYFLPGMGKVWVTFNIVLTFTEAGD